MVLNAIAEKPKHQSKDDFEGRQFEAWLIRQAVAWYLRYPLSYRDLEEMFKGCAGLVESPKGHSPSLAQGLR